VQGEVSAGEGGVPDAAASPADRALTRRTASATRSWPVSLAGWFTASQLPYGTVPGQADHDHVRVIAIGDQL